MTFCELFAAGGATYLVLISFTLGATTIGQWAYKRGFDAGRQTHDDFSPAVDDFGVS